MLKNNSIQRKAGKGGWRTRIVLSLLLLPLSIFAQRYTISTFDYQWCTASFPAAWQSGNFSIVSDVDCVFRKNQANRTFHVTLSGPFEFNTASTTAYVSVGGNYITLDCGAPYNDAAGCFEFVSNQEISIRYSTANVNDVDAIYFHDFEIRATGAGTGELTRNGGNAEVRGQTGGGSDCSGATYNTSNPVESFGTFVSQLPATYTETEVFQSQSMVDITQYSINNRILQVNVKTSGDCASDLTEFTFNTVGTAGTDLASNITAAKVYYTGSSGTFATTNLFGTYASPDGVFTITGLQPLNGGNNYFWLTYDVPGDANTDNTTPLNRLDAQLESFEFNGTTITSSFITPNPVGYRPIIGATFYYSRENGTWNNSTTRWSTTDGGASCSCQPNGSGVVVVSHNITLDQNRTVDVVEIRDGASLVHSGANRTLAVNSSLITNGSGYFNLRALPLTVLGNMVLNGSGQSENTSRISISGDLTINGTAGLEGTGGGAATNHSIEVGGNLTVEGTLTHSGSGGSGAKDIYMNGGVFSLSGGGTIGPIASGSFIIQNGNKTIPAGSDLTINDDVTIEGAYVVTNNGIVSITGNLNGNNAASQWTNAVGSVLNYGGANKPFNTNGLLSASANPNTVEYNREGNQNVVRPDNGQYHHLIFSGSGNKTLDLNVKVRQDLTLNATLNHGDRTVELNGTTQQQVTGIFAPTFYNLIVANSSGTSPQVTFGAAPSVTNILTMTSGNIDLSGNTLTLGTSAANAGILSHSSGWIYGGSFTRWLSTGTIANGNARGFFPLGTPSHVRPFYVSAPATGPTTGGTITLSHTDATTVSTVSFVDNDVTVTRRHDAFWTMTTANGLAGGTYNLVAGGTNFGTIGDIDHLRLTRVGSVVGNAGTNAGTTANPEVSRTGLTLANLSNNFYIASIDALVSPLPIDLLFFSAESQEKAVLTKWVTASEINNKEFNVERSADGKKWVSVGKVPGAGNSSQTQKYNWVDATPLSGISYYRLQQVDFDGSSTHSSIVAVSRASVPNDVKVFPNPADNTVTVHYSEEFFDQEPVQAMIISLEGRIVKQFLLEKSSENLDISNLPAGLYILKLMREGQQVYVERLAIVK